MSYRETINKIDRIFRWLLLACIVMFALVIFFNYRAVAHCNVTDKEAYAIALSFSNRTGVSLKGEPHVQPNRFVVLSEIKDYGWSQKTVLRDTIAFHENIFSYYPYIIDTSYKGLFFDTSEFDIACDSGRVIRFKDNKYFGNDYKENILKFTDDMERIKYYEKMIQLPSDLVLVEHTREKGILSAYYHRFKDNFSYQFERAWVGIGDEGQLVGFNLSYHGTECSTDMKIGKEKAVELAWEEMKRIIGKEDWKLVSEGFFAVESTEPLIITPDRIRLPFRNNPSRLAWIVKFQNNGDPYVNELRRQMNDETLDPKVRGGAFMQFKLVHSSFYQINMKFRSEIQIDAITGEVLND